MNRCGGEKKSSNGCVACQWRSQPVPMPMPARKKARASHNQICARRTALPVDSATVAETGGEAAMALMRRGVKPFHAREAANVSAAPELFGRDARSFGTRRQLGPGDLGMAYALAEAAIGAGDHVLASHEGGVA